jgi:hypothetical protein
MAPAIPTDRDLRLDLFRGLALWFIYLDHIPSNIVAWITIRNYGFSDGADLFVFISGYTATLVFGQMMLTHGFVVGATRLMRRVWQLYVAHVLLFVFYMTSVHYVAHSFDIPHLMDQFNVARLMEYPVETLSQGLLLRLKPLNLDVLPLYIVLMALLPPVLWLMLRWRNLVMIGAVALYFAARHCHWNLQAYPDGVWYFNPFTWQLTFIFGAWLVLGGGHTLHSVIRSRLALVLSVGFVIFAFFLTLSERIPDLQILFPAPVLEVFLPNDKTNLAPWRVLHLASLTLLIVRFVPIDWPGLTWPLFRPLIKCGQQSLAVFCVGVFLSFLAHLVLDTVSSSALTQLLVGITGLSVMTGVAYYRSWSKDVDIKTKAVREGFHRRSPRTDQIQHQR